MLAEDAIAPATLYCRLVLANWWRAYRPPPADVAVAAAFTVLGQLVTWGVFDEASHAGSRPTNAILNLLLMAALAWRRRAPLAAVSWALVVYFLPRLAVPLDVSFWAGGVPLIVLTASAAYYCSRRRAVLAALVALVALVALTVTAPELRSLDGFVWNGLIMFVPWLGARGLREREDRAASLAAALATERASKDAALRDAAAAERAHIARELHDIVAHSVSTMVIQIGAARMQLEAGRAAAESPLLDAEAAGRQTLADLRRLLGVLRADEPADGAGRRPQPPQPGLSDLDALVAQTRAAGLRVDVNVVGDRLPLPAALDLTSYRIVQEALTNALKHGGAMQATVSLRYTPSTLFVEVVDDGTPAPAAEDGGHGLIGIAERASLFGGSATAGPGERGGWRVHAELPLSLAALEDERPAPLAAP